MIAVFKNLAQISQNAKNVRVMVQPQNSNDRLEFSPLFMVGLKLDINQSQAWMDLDRLQMVRERCQS